MTTIKAGMKVSQIAHPEYGTWIIREQAHAAGRVIGGMWHVRGNTGEIVVDGAELETFWQESR